MGLRLHGFCGFLFSFAALFACHANAQEDRGTYNLLIENDRFVNTDRHYTHGTRLSWLSPADDVPGWARGVVGHLPFFASNGTLRIGYGLGQSIFTPEDTNARALLTKDRPYAGWLYGSLSLVSDTGERLDSIELDLGMVGPASLARAVQNNFHDLIGVSRSNGWGNQLDNEPGFALYFERKWRKLKEFSAHGLGVDLTPHVGGSLGNVFTYLASGLAVRFGENLPSDYGPPRIRPSLPGTGFFVPQDGFGWYVFAGAEARLIGRNIFLDGNSFSDSQDVAKKVLVGDFQIGLALTFQRFRITFSQIARTREFRGQSQADKFGAISLSAKF